MALVGMPLQEPGIICMQSWQLTQSSSGDNLLGTGLLALPLPRGCRVFYSHVEGIKLKKLPALTIFWYMAMQFSLHR